MPPQTCPERRAAGARDMAKVVRNPEVFTESIPVRPITAPLAPVWLGPLDRPCLTHKKSPKRRQRGAGRGCTPQQYVANNPRSCRHAQGRSAQADSGVRDREGSTSGRSRNHGTSRRHTVDNANRAAVSGANCHCGSGAAAAVQAPRVEDILTVESRARGPRHRKILDHND
jgi:hypothetical protein